MPRNQQSTQVLELGMDIMTNDEDTTTTRIRRQRGYDYENPDKDDTTRRIRDDKDTTTRIRDDEDTTTKIRQPTTMLQRRGYNDDEDTIRRRRQ